MVTSMVRYGVIGCGEIAVQTCQGISAARNASIAMLMDTRREVLRDLAEVYSAPTTTDVDVVLTNPDIDAVYIATPHYLHAPIGIAAARAGKHVLVEKPIATTLEDADALIAACREYRVKLGVAFLAQVDAALTSARALVRAGVIGKIQAIRYTALSDKPDTYWHGGYTRRVHTDWRTSKTEAGGGILIMNVVHDLNTVRYVTALEVQRVYAEYDTLNTPVEVEDIIGVVMRYTSGAVGVIQAGSSLVGGGHTDAAGPRVYGTKGQIILGSRPLICLAEPWEGRAAREWGEVPFSGPAGDRAQLIERFGAAILADREPPATGIDGRKALEIIVAAYQSGETGQPIVID